MVSMYTKGDPPDRPYRNSRLNGEILYRFDAFAVRLIQIAGRILVRIRFVFRRRTLNAFWHHVWAAAGEFAPDPGFH